MALDQMSRSSPGQKRVVSVIDLSQRLVSTSLSCYRSLFVYLIVPKQVSEREFQVLMERGVRLVVDVLWIGEPCPVLGSILSEAS